jgi:hypothetical protein
MRTAFAAIALCLVARASAGAARSPACDAVTAPPPPGRKLLGKGEHLDPPPLPTATPLTVQLRGSTDACWETFYPAENVTQDARRLLGRGGLP